MKGKARLLEHRGEPDYWIEFTLRNACVTFFDDAFSRYRSAFLSLGEPLDAMVHGFTEYTMGYQRLTVVRTPRDADRTSRCERGPPRAIGVPFSCNNIYQCAPALRTREQSHHTNPCADRLSHHTHVARPCCTSRPRAARPSTPSLHGKHGGATPSTTTQAKSTSSLSSTRQQP
jgi:hypothetical protein